MDYSLLCIEGATRICLSDATSRRLRPVFRTALRPTINLHEMMSAREAGTVLCAAMIGGEPATAIKAVVSAALQAVDPIESAIPDECSWTTEVLPWIGASLGDAIAIALMAGATATAPELGDLELHYAEGVLGGRQCLTFQTEGGPLRVAALYGHPVASETPINIGGRVLLSIGDLARRFSPRPESSEEQTLIAMRSPSVRVH